MSAMIDAIKKRRGLGGGHPHGGHEGQSEEGGGADLHALIAGLSHEEKSNLQQILSEDMGNASEITKGAPSSEEHKKIGEAIGKENEMNAAEEGEEEIENADSDAIGKSMLDSRDMGSNPITEPRNLGERMRMSVTNKLKAKGKL